MDNFLGLTLSLERVTIFSSKWLTMSKTISPFTGNVFLVKIMVKLLNLSFINSINF